MPPDAAVARRSSTKRVSAGVAPLYSSPSPPPKIVGLAVGVDLGGAEHDPAARRATASNERVVGVRVVARLGELDVVGDHRRAGLGQRARSPSRARVRSSGSCRRRPRRASCRRSPTITTSGGGVLRAAHVEARVDASRARAALQRVGRPRRPAARAAASSADREQQRPGATAGAAHAAPTTIAARNSESTWKDWSTDAASAEVQPVDALDAREVERDQAAVVDHQVRARRRARRRRAPRPTSSSEPIQMNAGRNASV